MEHFTACQILLGICMPRIVSRRYWLPLRASRGPEKTGSRVRPSGLKNMNHRVIGNRRLFRDCVTWHMLAYLLTPSFTFHHCMLRNLSRSVLHRLSFTSRLALYNQYRAMSIFNTSKLVGKTGPFSPPSRPVNIVLIPFSPHHRRFVRNRCFDRRTVRQSRLERGHPREAGQQLG